MNRLLFSISLALLLAGAEPALAQFAVRGAETANGGGVLSGGAFSAAVTVGQAVTGTASNADFAAAFGQGAQVSAALPTGVEVAPADGEAPHHYRLDQNYPNPFNPETAIAFEVPRAGHVTLAVYNALGQQVAVLTDEARPAGRYEVTWNAAGLPSGLYLYQIRADGFQAVRKMVLIK